MTTTNITLSDPTAPFGAGGNSSSGTPVDGGKGWGRGKRHVCRTGPDGKKTCALVYYRGEKTRDPKHYIAATDGDLWFDNSTDCTNICSNWDSTGGNRNFPQGTVAGDAQRRFEYIRRISNLPSYGTGGKVVALPERNIVPNSRGSEQFELLRQYDSWVDLKIKMKRDGITNTSGEALALSANFLPGITDPNSQGAGYTLLRASIRTEGKMVAEATCTCKDPCIPYLPFTVFENLPEEKREYTNKRGDGISQVTVQIGHNGTSKVCCGECHLDPGVYWSKSQSVLPVVSEKLFYYPGYGTSDKQFEKVEAYFGNAVAEHMLDTLTWGSTSLRDLWKHLAKELDGKDCTMCEGGDGNVILA